MAIPSPRRIVETGQAHLWRRGMRPDKVKRRIAPQGALQSPSGAVGILAFAFLFAAVRTRTDIALSLSSPTYLMFKAHDVGSWGSS
jgi:hypothetical protein